MGSEPRRVHWGTLILTALLVYISSFGVVFLTIVVYAFLLGFQARGAPDPARIQQFANQVGPWGGRLALVLLTVGASAWLARRRDSPAQTYGILLGVIVGLPNLLAIRSLGLAAVGVTVAAILAGWLGSFVVVKPISP